MKRKRLLSVLMTFTMSLTLILTGCGSQTSSSSESSNGTVTLKLLHRWPNEPNKSFIDKVVKDFESTHKNIKVDVQSIANDSYKQKIKVILGSNSAPDIFFTWNGDFLNQFVRSNKVYDLTSALKGSWGDSLIKSQIDAYSYKGKDYGVAYAMDGKVFFYNKKIFSSAGIAQAPSTFDELIDDCKKIQAKGITPISFGDQATWANSHYIGTLNVRTVDPSVRAKDYEPTTGSFTDPQYITALQKLQELMKYATPNANGVSHEQARQDFINGKAGMMFLETEEVAEMQKAPKDFDWDMFQFPSVTGGAGNQTTMTGAPEGFAIAKSTKHAKEAIEFLKYLTSKEVAAEELKETGYVSGLKGIENVDVGNPKLTQSIKMLEQASNMANWMDADLESRVGSTYLSEVQKLIGNEATPEQVMKAVQDSAKQVKEDMK